MRRATIDGTLTVGYLAVAAALAVARANPASAYESSVYVGTPTATWVGFAVALAIAVGTTLTCRGRDQALAIALGGTVVTSIVALPTIRNYRFFGMGDALTHLGWTRDIVAGDLYPHELFYPAIHSFGSVLHHLGGVPIERALLLTVVLVFVPFLVFVPLVARDLSGSAVAVGMAAIVSWMVLPINNVATHLGVHTNSNALFLVPVVVFAIVAYIRRRPTHERLPLGISPYSVLVYLGGIALLLVHPQQMVNVVILTASIAVVQALAGYRFADHPILEHPRTYVHTVGLGTIFAIWAATNVRFREAVLILFEGVLAEEIGTAATVTEREGSLAEIGGSLGELFVTMFFEAAVIGLIVAAFVLLTWLGRTATDRESAAFVTYFGVALVPLGGLFALYFVGTPTMAFRQLGFIFVILTILGGVALAHLYGGLARFVTTPGANAVVSLALGALLVLGLVTLYASPLIYDPGQHVTDEQFSGYEAALHDGASDQPLVALGYDPFRYDHGLNGLEGEETLSGATVASGEVDPEAFEAGNVSGAYHGLDYYLAVTAYDVTREIEVYQELYYSEAALEALEHDPAANKVVANDEFELYDVESDGVAA